MILLNYFKKYQGELKEYKHIVENIVDKFNNNIIYKNINSKYDFSFLNNNNNYDLRNNIIIHGNDDSVKEYIMNEILEKIYGKQNIITKNQIYVINGYANIKTNITIKQSKNHIIIEPCLKNIDKYLVHEIVNLYISQKELNIFKKKKLYKIIVINKIDDLNFQTQSFLKSIIEKYSDVCRFIFISNRLSKINQCISSRCVSLRIPDFKNIDLFNILSYVICKENIKISLSNIINIINKSKNKISIALLSLEYYTLSNDISNIESYDKYIEIIINIIIDIKKDSINDIKKKILKIREVFYLLYISNINTVDVINLIAHKLIAKLTNIQLIYDIINYTMIYSIRISKGSKSLIHCEAYYIKLMHILYNTQSY